MNVLRWISFVVGCALYLFACQFEDYTERQGKYGPPGECLASCAVVTAPADRINPANEEKVVCVQGKVTGEEPLNDPQFGISANGLILNRTVAFTVESSGRYGPNTTWREPDQDDAEAAPFQLQSSLAHCVKLGAYTLSPRLFEFMDDMGKVIKFNSSNLKSVPAAKDSPLFLDDQGNLWAGKKDATDNQTIAFKYLPNPGVVTVLALQRGTELIPYKDEAVLLSGQQSLEKMVSAARADSREEIWTQRWFALLLLLFASVLICNTAPKKIRLGAIAKMVLPWWSTTAAFTICLCKAHDSLWIATAVLLAFLSLVLALPVAAGKFRSQ